VHVTDGFQERGALDGDLHVPTPPVNKHRQRYARRAPKLACRGAFGKA
jgi:hypothetical protein